MNSKGLWRAEPLVTAGMQARFVYVTLGPRGASYSTRPVSVGGSSPPAWASTMTQHMLLLDFRCRAQKLRRLVALVWTH